MGEWVQGQTHRRLPERKESELRVVLHVVERRYGHGHALGAQKRRKTFLTMTEPRYEPRPVRLRMESGFDRWVFFDGFHAANIFVNPSDDLVRRVSGHPSKCGVMGVCRPLLVALSGDANTCT
jgi:hypothetical protein